MAKRRNFPVLNDSEVKQAVVFAIKSGRYYLKKPHLKHTQKKLPPDQGGVHSKQTEEEKLTNQGKNQLINKLFFFINVLFQHTFQFKAALLKHAA